MSCNDAGATHHTGCACWEAKRDAREKHLEDLLKKALTHIGRFGWSDVWMQEVNQTINEIRHAIYEAPPKQ